jgi:hypothetical protein
MIRQEHKPNANLSQAGRKPHLHVTKKNGVETYRNDGKEKQNPTAIELGDRGEKPYRSRGKAPACFSYHRMKSRSLRSISPGKTTRLRTRFHAHAHRGSFRHTTSSDDEGKNQPRQHRADLQDPDGEKKNTANLNVISST